MPINKDNQLKFKDGSITEPITILKAGPEELPFGTKYLFILKILLRVMIIFYHPRV